MLGPRLYVRNPLHLSLHETFTCIHRVQFTARTCFSEALQFQFHSKEIANILHMCLDPQINTNLYDRHLVHAA
jgi:hypothetical protein